MEKKNEYREIDVLSLFQAWWKKIWLIILTGLIIGGTVCACTIMFATPLYKASILLYVNNNALSVGDTKLSISQGDLTAAQSLVDTYGVILKTRSTLEEVIEKTKVPYTYEDLSKMVESSAVNSTEIFYVEVTSPRPKEAELIANTIGQVLPEKIASIVDGSSVRIVDPAVIPVKKSSPSITKNTILGFAAGIMISCAFIAFREIHDDQIHGSDYLIDTYAIPVLAEIPELSSNEHGKDYCKSSYGGHIKEGG